MFPVILAVGLFLYLLYVCGRHYLKNKRDLIVDSLTMLLRALIG